MARNKHAPKHVIALGLGLTLFGGAAHAEVIGLQELEQRALRAHPELEAQSAKIRRAEAEVELAASASRPTIAGRVDGSLAPGGQLVEIPAPEGAPYLVSGARAFGDPDAFLPQPRYSAGVAVNSTLFDFGRSSLQQEAARAKAGAEQAALDQGKRQILLDVRGAYTRWLSADQTWQIASAQYERLKTFRSTIEQLIAEGARPSSDAALARYEEQRGELGALRARAARDLARAALETMLQTDLPDTATPDPALLETDAAQPGAAPEPDDRTASALLERQRQAAALSARSLDKRSPVLAGAAEAGVRGQNTSVFPVYRVGVSLTIPIWDGGEQSARSAMARAEADALAARASQARRQEQAQAELMRTQEELANQELALAQGALQTAETLVQQAEERYQLGGGGLDPVLDSQRTLMSAKLDLLQARIGRLNAKLKLVARPAGNDSGS